MSHRMLSTFLKLNKKSFCFIHSHEPIIEITNPVDQDMESLEVDWSQIPTRYSSTKTKTRRPSLGQISLK